jgi:hypothetical protein
MTTVDKERPSWPVRSRRRPCSSFPYWTALKCPFVDMPSEATSSTLPRLILSATFLSATRGFLRNSSNPNQWTRALPADLPIEGLRRRTRQ